MQSYEKSSEMHNKNSILFSFPCAEDSKLVSLGSSKSFGKARVTVILENFTCFLEYAAGDLPEHWIYSTMKSIHARGTMKAVSPTSRQALLPSTVRRSEFSMKYRQIVV